MGGSWVRRLAAQSAGQQLNRSKPFGMKGIDVSRTSSRAIDPRFSPIVLLIRRLEDSDCRSTFIVDCDFWLAVAVAENLAGALALSVA
jgi:hypothetical protein